MIAPRYCTHASLSAIVFHYNERNLELNTVTNYKKNQHILSILIRYVNLYFVSIIIGFDLTQMTNIYYFILLQNWARMDKTVFTGILPSQTCVMQNHVDEVHFYLDCYRYHCYYCPLIAVIALTPVHIVVLYQIKRCNSILISVKDIINVTLLLRIPTTILYIIR